MSESQNGSGTLWGRAVVCAVVAAVALAGAGVFVVGGSPTTQAGSAADWSPHPGKEVTPDCPPANETSVENETTPDNETGTETDDSGYQLVINYTGAWQGTIVTNDTTIPIEGTGNERIDIEADEDERVAATVSKANVTNETMGVTLLLNGLVIDEQEPVEPTVDNFDDNDDGRATDSDTPMDSTLSSTSNTGSVNEAGTDGEWQTFGDENEASSFEDDTVVAADDDPFNDNDTANTSEDSLDSNDSDTTPNEPAVNDTNETDDVDERCAPANTTQSTNDTNATNDTTLTIETDEEAQVVLADQDVTGPSLVVESATVPDGGFVVIHNMSLMQEGNVEDSVVGVSDKLDAQRSEDIEVNLADEITESQTLVAVVYRDTDGDGEFEFDDTGEMVDKPYSDDNGSAVADDGYVTVPGADEADASAFNDTTTTTTASAGAQDTSVFTDTETTTATATDTATTTDTPSTAMSGNAAEQSTETNAPGFGIGVAVVAMLGTVLLAKRRF